MFASGNKSSGLLGSSESSNNPLNRIPGFEEEPACAKMCPQLSYQQRFILFCLNLGPVSDSLTGVIFSLLHRLIGFACCAAFGWVLSIIGTLILLGGTSAANIRIFIVFYIFGNVICKFEPLYAWCSLRVVW
jgi:hypothetical protein